MFERKIFGDELKEMRFELFRSLAAGPKLTASGKTRARLEPN
jgi:hypothetical protein